MFVFLNDTCANSKNGGQFRHSMPKNDQSSHAEIVVPMRSWFISGQITHANVDDSNTCKKRLDQTSGLRDRHQWCPSSGSRQRNQRFSQEKAHWRGWRQCSLAVYLGRHPVWPPVSLPHQHSADDRHQWTVHKLCFNNKKWRLRR